VIQGCSGDITQPSEPRLALNVGLGSLSGEPDCSGGGGWWTQVRTPSGLGTTASLTTPPDPYPLTPVVVYGNPSSGPRWGTVGVTSTIVYGRDGNMQACEFGADYSWQYAPDSLRPTYIDVPLESPFGIQDTLWARLSKRERATLLRVAKELAVLPAVVAIIPGLRDVLESGRELYIWNMLGMAYLRAQDQVPGMRGDSHAFVQYTLGRSPFPREHTRIDAYLRGCSTAKQMRVAGYESGERIVQLSSELGGNWAADLVGANASQWYFSNRLAFLSAEGAKSGNDGDSCAQSATEYFRVRQGELFDPGTGGGGTEF
jgi:hypothetical protein